jgi:membrane protein required for colicin V production
MNPFDAAILLCLMVAMFAGWRAGLLRSLATIFGYLCAAPVAIVFAPKIAGAMGMPFNMTLMPSWAVLFGTFLFSGIVISYFLRSAVSATVGETVSAPDRVAGAALGAVRVVLIAILMVLVFDRIIPANREPQFLAGSKLRPVLTVAGKSGVRSLPPDMVAYIDKLKRERGI